LDYQRALARARDLVRNNEYVAGAIETFAANVIGQGITPQATVGKARGQKLDEAFNTQAQSLFDDWAQWSGFYEQQELIVKHLVVDGESLGHFVIDNNGIRKPRMPPGGKEYVWLMKASRRTRNKAGRQYSRRKQKTSC
jgi:capsid protein